jgi:hypothetical protein
MRIKSTWFLYTLLFELYLAWILFFPFSFVTHVFRLYAYRVLAAKDWGLMVSVGLWETTYLICMKPNAWT